MGRAIDMAKDIDKLKLQVDRIDAALAKVIDVIDSMEDKGQRTTHIDLVEDVPPEHDQVDFENGVEEEAEKKPKSKKSNEKAKRTKKD